MSVYAMSWVFAQDIKPSSRKFILLALADCMNDEEGCAYPSVCTLELKTCLDRKTVIEGIQDLISQGYLIDTEQRVGRTKQVRVLRLNGLPSLKNHYVYKVTRQDTGEFYIGCRSSFETPERDEYFGSGSWPMQMARARVPLLKVIMGSFAARYEAECFEAQTIQRLIGDPLCRNSRKSAAITNGRFNSPENGTVSVEQQSRFSDETVPLFPLKGPAFSVKGPENGTRNHQEPLEEPLKEPIPCLVGPEQVYQAYPRKVGKPAAIKAIDRAIKAHGLERVLSRTRAYAKARADQDPAFTPYPQKFFNQEMFNDDPATWSRKSFSKAPPEWDPNDPNYHP